MADSFKLLVDKGWQHTTNTFLSKMRRWSMDNGGSLVNHINQAWEALQQAQAAALHHEESKLQHELEVLLRQEESYGWQRSWVN